ncbi:Short chain dehydrogenase citE [Colletotrichum orbiculare MAFF 240422]|uniref:Short chain dehydrogenase citE n=1 Tax=Colletotrichum orbiculare (strain 104-T / ATCC 96160 / CBS 514.97 / LARS 414 / MAFF 240422) TaxID=1213857 RepID=N4V4D2_COLOR|nr:Short chain dehydrogenase citE [Colletotrichum orbiculare MAFF 240422]
MSYTQTTHNTSYPAISPSNPANSASGKVILITGAGSGIGQAAAASFAEAGARTLVLIGRRSDSLTETAEFIRAKHPTAEVTRHAVDVSDADALKAVMVEAVSDFGSIDVVVHAAGVLPELRPIATTPVDELWKAFEVNIKGTLIVAQALLAVSTAVKEDGSEPVLVAVNTAGVLVPPMPGMGGYVVSKAPLLKLVEYIAAENAGRIRVVSVHPGIVQTPMAVELEKSGLKFPYDDISLPADFLVWVTGSEAAFLNGKFASANWDVEELMARKEEIKNSSELTLALDGFPRTN